MDIHGYWRWTRPAVLAREFITNLRFAGYEGALSVEMEAEYVNCTEGVEKAMRYLKPLILNKPPGTPWRAIWVWNDEGGQSVCQYLMGCACLLPRLEGDGGPVIVMDPFNPPTLTELGMPYDGRTLDGDVVIVSSLTDPAHGNPKLVKGNPRIINALDLVVHGTEAEVDGSKIVALGVGGIPPTHPDGPRDNALYAVKVGSEWVMHLRHLQDGLPAMLSLWA